MVVVETDVGSALGLALLAELFRLGFAGHELDDNRFAGCTVKRIRYAAVVFGFLAAVGGEFGAENALEILLERAIEVVLVLLGRHFVAPGKT